MPTFRETIEVKQNLCLTFRERGKIVARRVGHNIWVDLGRTYLASLISYASFGPDTAEQNNRIKYMGLGIGGTRQTSLSVANSSPMSDAYPGNNTQTDTDPTVTTLERPVRVSGTTTDPPYDAGDVWLGRVQAPVIHSPSTVALFRRVFTSAEVSYSTFLAVPLSEVGLFTAAANPTGVPNNTFVAYDTFDTLTKTAAFELQVDWEIRF
jgi:hypothetical protein